jgi:hypothetical protein
MKKTLFALLVVGTVASAAPRPASAQTDPAVVKVPFQFIVGDRLMPAGSYRITSNERDRTLLTISGLDGKVGSVFASTQWSGARADSGAQVNVQFKNIDGHYFLALVAIPGADVRAVPLTKVRAERTLARLNLMPAEHANSAK